MEKKYKDVDFASDAEWQEAINIAHAIIMLDGKKLKELGFIDDAKLQRCWDIQTAASMKGLTPKHTVSAFEREYKRLLIQHELLDEAGQYIGYCEPK